MSKDDWFNNEKFGTSPVSNAYFFICKEFSCESGHQFNRCDVFYTLGERIFCPICWPDGKWPPLGGVTECKNRMPI